MQYFCIYKHGNWGLDSTSSDILSIQVNLNHGEHLALLNGICSIQEGARLWVKEVFQAAAEVEAGVFQWEGSQ